MDASLSGIDAVFLDLDGTIYLGGNLIEGAEAFLERCKKHGVQRYFLSNNSSKSVAQYLTKLHTWPGSDRRRRSPLHSRPFGLVAEKQHHEDVVGWNRRHEKHA